MEYSKQNTITNPPVSQWNSLQSTDLIYNPGYKGTHNPQDSLNHKIKKTKCQCCGLEYEIILRCGDRLCPVCREKDYWRYYYKYKRIVNKFSMGKHLILTMKNPENLTKKSIRDFLTCCKTFRKVKFFKGKIIGGIFFLQVNYDVAKGWHPHGHFQLLADFIPQKILKDIWSDTIGYESETWITEWSSPQRLLRYILADLTEPKILPLEKKLEFNKAMRGVRMIQTFGKIYKLKFDEINNNAMKNIQGLCKNCRKKLKTGALT